MVWISLRKAVPVEASGATPKAARVLRDNDRAVKHILTAIALVSVAIIFFIILFTLYNSWDAISEVGILEFIFGTKWSPDNDAYGASALIIGTILVTLGAMVICVPLGLAAALFLSEVASERTRNILKPVCEIFAGIPSVIYGFFGMIVLIPMMVRFFPDQTAYGSCWLAASLILGIMALPTIISVSDDAIRSVPRSYREASLAMGATRWETMRKVVVPAALSGISAAIILGIGRAIGETMAVIMVAGNAAIVPEPLYNVFSLIRTITASIALEMPDLAIGSVHYSALFLLALILMVFVVAINLVARYIIDSNRRKMGMDVGKRRFNMPSLVTPEVRDRIEAMKPMMIRVFVLVLAFAFVWMMSSLFVGELQALGYAAVATAVVAAMMFLGSRRTSPRMTEKAAFGGLTLSMVVILGILAAILWDILSKGVPALTPDFITSPPSNGGRAGGIGPAIIGTLQLIVGTAVIALPLGVIAGVWLSQYAGGGRVASIVRHAVDALNGTPSIVFGLFGMAAFVVMAGWGYTLLGGCLTLAFMILPVIIRTTEEAVSAVPHDLLEASMAMGASKWQSIVKVILPAAMGGIMTGSILGLGRAAGETAPIMFTATIAFSRTVGFAGPMEPIMSLPYHLYYLAMEVPNSELAQYGTATVLLLIVLIMFGAASLIRYRYSKNMKW